MMKYAARSVTDLYKEPATIYTQDLDEKGNKSALDMLRTFEDTISLVKKAQNWQYRAVFLTPIAKRSLKMGSLQAVTVRPEEAGTATATTTVIARMTEAMTE